MKVGPMIGVLLISVSGVAATPREEAVAAAVAGPTDIKARAEAVVAIDRNVHGAATVAVMNAFRLIKDRELEPSLLATYDTRTLEVLFDAVAIALERLRRPNLLQAMEDIFQESLSRGFIGHMVDSMYAGYVHRRDWQKARKLYERFPAKERELPTIVEPAAIREGVPAVYVVSKDGGTLTYTTVDLAGPIIVSVVSPGCHFSNDVVQRIEAEPRLATLFREHAINIDPAPYRLNAAELARVNRDGQFRYAILYRESDWKDFDFSATPRFYFVKGGEIVHKIHSVQPDASPISRAARARTPGRRSESRYS